MTKRDKVLLVVLGVLLLLFIPNYFLTPQLVSGITDARAQYQTLSVAHSAYQQMLGTLPNLRQYRSILDTELAGELPETQGMTKTYELHYLFTELASQNDIELTSLQLGSFTELAAPEFTEEQLAGFANQIAGITFADFAAVPDNAVKVQSIPVSLSINGTRDNILKLVDAMNDYSDYLVINSISVPMDSESEIVGTNLAATVYIVSPTGGTAE